MAGPVEDMYFTWLCAQVGVNPSRPDYTGLLGLLHQYEFIPLLDGDHNRAAEGVGVREEFLRAANVGQDPTWGQTGCSIFELFLGFAKRAEWETSMSYRDWFWKIIENLKLEDYRRVDPDDIPDIEEILYRLVWRTYDDNGIGGMFPLRTTPYDQRRVEIWYQFCEYVNDNGLI